MPAVEPILMMTPPCPRISGTTACVNMNRPFTLTAKTRSNSFSLTSSIGLLGCATPALLTSTLSPPNLDAVSTTAASMSLRLVTSQRMAMAALPIRDATVLAALPSISTTATCAPSRA